MALMMDGRFQRAGRVLRRHASLFILLCASAAATGASATPEPGSHKAAKLLVATDDNYPPYIFATPPAP